MKFLVLTYALMAICVIQVTCMCFKKTLPPHEGSEIDCTGRRMELNRYMKDVTCTPRPTHVKLIPERGYTLYPDYAMVNRCGGFCPNSKSCLPVKTSNKTIIVTRESYNSSQCYEVSVKEHVKCKCACSVMPHHCSSHHIYSQENCACQCMNREACDESRQMVWDETMCKCMCNKPMEICTSGLEWVQSRCRCVKVSEELNAFVPNENIIQEVN